MDESQELRHRLSKLSDEELVTIVTVEAADYRQEALEFARTELVARGIDYENPPAEEATPRESGTRPTLDRHGLGCSACGGQLRPGTLAAEKEITIIFSDKHEERFVRVAACSQCGQISMVADYQAEVEGS